MGFTIKMLSADDVKAEFKRQGNDIDKLDDYVDNLKSMTVGMGFTMKIVTVLEGDKISSETVDGTEDTIRTFKRRINAAAKSLNLVMKWKEKGHSHGNLWVRDYLMARVVNTGSVTA